MRFSCYSFLHHALTSLFAVLVSTQDLLPPNQAPSRLDSDRSERNGEFQGRLRLCCPKKIRFSCFLHIMHSPHCLPCPLSHRTSSRPTNTSPASIVIVAKGTVSFRVGFHCLGIIFITHILFRFRDLVSDIIPLDIHEVTLGLIITHSKILTNLILE